MAGRHRNRLRITRRGEYVLVFLTGAAFALVIVGIPTYVW